MRASLPTIVALVLAFLAPTAVEGRTLAAAALGDTNFPCTSGDWKSSETAKVLTKNKLWWWKTQDDKLPRESWPIQSPERVAMFEEVCPAQFETRSRNGTFTPVENFLALCELQMQFPPIMDFQYPEKKFLVRRGPNRLCNDIKKEIRKMNLTAANEYFCSGRGGNKVHVHNLWFSEVASVESQVEKGLQMINHRSQCHERYPQYLAG